MAKVTRIVYSKNLNRDKLDQLIELASRLGRLRKEIWHRFGSLSGMGLTHQKIRDQWLEEKRKFDVPARLWKETLRDTFEDIKAYRESAKAKVRKAIYRRADDEIERKRFYTFRNILSRLYDDEIQLYMPFKDVKNVLLERTGRFEKRLGLLNQDSSCSGQLLLFPLSTDLPAAGRERITF